MNNLKKVIMKRKVRIVRAHNVADYLKKYYKKDRMTPTLLAYYKEQLRNYGYICTSHFDNVTGEFIAWPYYPKGGIS